MIEYPKQLYLYGWDDLDASVVVHDAEQEAEARKAGYKMLSESSQPFETAPRKRRKAADGAE